MEAKGKTKVLQMPAKTCHSKIHPTVIFPQNSLEYRQKFSRWSKQSNTRFTDDIFW